jgi:hypothetical protein
VVSFGGGRVFGGVKLPQNAAGCVSGVAAFCGSTVGVSVYILLNILLGVFYMFSAPPLICDSISVSFA